MEVESEVNVKVKVTPAVVCERRKNQKVANKKINIFGPFPCISAEGLLKNVKNDQKGVCGCVVVRLCSSCRLPLFCRVSGLKLLLKVENSATLICECRKKNVNILRKNQFFFYILDFCSGKMGLVENDLRSETFWIFLKH